MLLQEMRQDIKELGQRVSILEEALEVPTLVTEKGTTLPTTLPKKVEDNKVEITYTDPQEQFIEEMRERLGMTTAKEEDFS